MIRSGEIGNIRVFEEENRVLVELNTFHDEARKQFQGKTKTGFYSEFAKDHDIEIRKSHSLFQIDKANLNTPEKINDFNRKVAQADILSGEYYKELDDIISITAFDVTDKKFSYKLGKDKDLTKPGEYKNWAFGTVVAKTPKYVALTSGENSETQFFRILPTSDFLPKNLEKNEQIAFLNDNLQVGKHKKLSWTSNDDKTAVSKIIVTDAVAPSPKVEQDKKAQNQAVQNANAETANQDSKNKTKKKSLSLAA